MIDILSSVLGLGALDKLAINAETFEIGGKACCVIGLTDLIQAKEALGRDKDLLAAKELRLIATKRHPKGTDG